MPLEIEQLPGGGVGVAEALGGVAEDVQKDRLALRSLQMPGLREAMGPEITRWIETGPGAHRRLGTYLQHADRVSGGKVTQARQVAGAVQQRLGGQPFDPAKHMAVAYEEAAKAGMTKADVDNYIKTLGGLEIGVARARGTAGMRGFTLGPGQVRYGPGGEELARGTARETITDIIGRARQDPEFMALIRSGKQWKQLTPDERLTAASALTGQTTGSAVLRAQRIFGTPTLMEQLMELGAEDGAADLDVPTPPPAAPGTDLSEEEADRLINLGRGR